MSQFTVRGTFKTRDGQQAFTRQLEAANENVAREHTFARFGAEHNLKRTEVAIEEVTAE